VYRQLYSASSTIFILGVLFMAIIKIDSRVSSYSGLHPSWPVGDRFLNVGYDVEGAIDGYINDLRISDYAVYTANFTPPTSPF
jgi:hypothetical protein